MKPICLIPRNLNRRKYLIKKKMRLLMKDTENKIFNKLYLTRNYY